MILKSYNMVKERKEWNEMLTSLGKYLRTLRIQQGELLKDMAEKLDVAAAYLSSIENGKREANKKFIDKIISAYRMTYEEEEKLFEAFQRTLGEVSFKLDLQDNEKTDLGIAFARKFNALDSEQIASIRNILEGDKR